MWNKLKKNIGLAKIQANVEKKVGVVTYSVELVRQVYSKKQVTGVLKVNEHTKAFGRMKTKTILSLNTLELDWEDNKKQVSCIPLGYYDIIPRTSAKFKEHYHVLDVPNRTFILIHPGNYHRQIEGCILVGKGLTDIDGDGYKDVTSSKVALSELKAVMKYSTGKGFSMEIRNAKNVFAVDGATICEKTNRDY